MMNMDNNGKTKQQRKARRSKPRQDHHLSQYIVFGLEGSICLTIFVIFYVLVLVTLWPLLVADPPKNIPEERPQDYIHNMHVPPSLAQAHVPKISEVAKGMKEKWQHLRKGQGVTDSNLLDETMKEFENKRKQREAAKKAILPNKSKQQEEIVIGGGANGQPTGFMVLGMHRSGTSMLSGLLHTSCGYTVGGPLIGSAFDNAKGFFERVDLVLQNDEFLKNQGAWWAANVMNYDGDKGYDAYLSKEVDFTKHGKTGLEFLTNVKNSPWMQKDPRMCITLKTWLNILNTEPAVVFTYRHPLEVAMSLKRREQNFTLDHGLRLWIIYNMRAIQNSKGLCMVKSSNDAVLADPMKEVQRVADELTSKCSIPSPPFRLSQEDVDKFIDPNLQHNKKQRALEEHQVVKEYNNGDCKVFDYESDYPKESKEKAREEKLYQMAMKIFCDFQNGEAYKDNYEWPDLLRL